MADERNLRRQRDLISAQNMLAMALAKNEARFAEKLPIVLDGIGGDLGFVFLPGTPPAPGFNGYIGYVYDLKPSANAWPILSQEVATDEEQCIQGFGEADKIITDSKGYEDIYPLGYKSSVATLPGGDFSTSAVAIQTCNSYHPNLLKHDPDFAYCFFYFTKWTISEPAMYRVVNKPEFAGLSYWHSSPQGDYLWKAPDNVNVANVEVREIVGGVATKILDGYISYNEEKGYYESEPFEVRANAWYYVSIKHDIPRFVFGENHEQQVAKCLVVTILKDGGSNEQS